MGITLVNATSLASRGGLTILNQYINSLIDNNDIDEKYFLFVPETCSVPDTETNIVIIKNNDNDFYKGKSFWNTIGLYLWCKKYDIKADCIYSLQNYYPLGFSGKGIYKKLYLHQPIPFYDYTWNVFNKRERSLWFYKYIYYWLIKKSVKESDEIIVQTSWLKSSLVKKIGINADIIFVDRPVISNIDTTVVQKINLDEGYKLFYPASSAIYKNHELLYDMMNVLVNNRKCNDVILYLTIDSEDYEAINYIKKYNLFKNIKLLGNISYEEVLRYYNSVDMLVFPSKIETFGLPLVEAQQFNLPIVAGDIDLYREVIGEYKNKVSYCDLDNFLEWAQIIEEVKR
ncbi:glycosyltransferase [Alloiococcus sp. CFN-8]|uniref:glycosyltransferase n=1 Tax=Alloiococcus sp. CFN-8 TaxID=3416081 RepID=UPI003CEED07C